MNAPPELVYTNCCQPEHCDGVLAPEQIAALMLLLVLSWSEKRLLVPPSLSVVRPVMLSKDPVAEEMSPPVACAEKSLPLPTISGARPLAGGYGRSGGVPHGTSTH